MSDRNQELDHGGDDLSPIQAQIVEAEDARIAQAKANFAHTAPGGSMRALLASKWMVDMEREQEGYTAGRWRTISGACSASLLIACFSVLYVLLFCSIQLSDDEEDRLGYGDEVFKTLIDVGSFGILIAMGTAALWSFIYVFDVWNWSDAGKVAGGIAKILIWGAMVLTFVTSLVITASFPALPLMTYWISLLGLLAALKSYMFPSVQKVYFLRATQLTLFLCSVIMIALYAVSVLGQEQYFGADVQIFFYAALDCEPVIVDGKTRTFQELVENKSLSEEFLKNNNPFEDCDEAFLVWAAPGLFFLVALLLSGVMFFLYRAEVKRIESKQAVGVEPLAQIFLAAMLLSLLGLWVSASIASATAAVGDAVLTISFMALILMMATAIAVFGIKYLDSQIKKTAIGKKAYEFFASNWGKGLLVVTSSPLILAFLGVDYLKQKIRTKTFLGKKIVDEDEKKMKFTKSVSQALEGASHWEWGGVIMIALIWGMLFFVLSVGISRMTIVFLSFLREAMLDLDLAEATGVLVAVGLFLFLLPPIPGVPVYVTAGVILPSIAENQDIGLLEGILYAIFIGTCLKLTALVMQQKLIGECCGSRSVAVRSAVGINSVELRAMKRVLTEGTFSWKKVAILCGGPDWPTSVLTGIMKLSVFKMLLGTTPIVFLIAPCVVSGAMLVKASEEPDDPFFTSINTVALFLTVVVQAAAMLAAAQVLATAAIKYKDELENEPLDMEVLELENRTRAKKLNYKAVTAWVNLSTFWRYMHVFSLILMIIACYAFQMFGTSLFITFDITDEIGKVLDGNVLKIVTEAGWFFISLFGVSVLYYFVFKQIHKHKTATLEQFAKADIDPNENEMKKNVGDNPFNNNKVNTGVTTEMAI